MMLIHYENRNNSSKGFHTRLHLMIDNILFHLFLHRMKKKFLTLFALLGFTVVIAQPEPPKPPSKAERLKHVTEKINKEICAALLNPHYALQNHDNQTAAAYD